MRVLVDLTAYQIVRGLKISLKSVNRNDRCCIAKQMTKSLLQLSDPDAGRVILS